MRDRAANRQEQKSEKARRTICEATVDCLADFGYAETSINRVVSRAGVSKGALQHHFPCKEALMTSTAAYLLARPLAFADNCWFQGADSREAALRNLLLHIWEKLMNTRAYLALLEILLAARTDALLHQRIADLLRKSIGTIDDKVLPMDSGATDFEREHVRMLLTANRCLMRGLLIETQYGLGAKRQRQVLECWLDLLVPALAELIEPDSTKRFGRPQP